MREKVLLAGETNTSKTLSLISLAILYPNRKVIIFDPDDGTEKVIEELGVELPNLTVIPVTPKWNDMMRAYKMLKSILTPDDWFCMDMMGRFWDFSQNYYSTTVFGESPSEHLIALKNQAKRTDFGGFDGLTDWSVIKRMHNEELVDDALLWSKFNVMGTTSVTNYLPVEKIPTSGTAGLIAKEFGLKLEGEKHNLFRYDTIAIMRRTVGQQGNPRFIFNLVKDKGRPINIRQEFDITGSSFWEKYCEYRGRSL